MCALRLLSVLVLFLPLEASAKDLGQWAQASPELRQWFKERKIPGGVQQGIPCCDISDGTWAEEDMRDGHYWVRFRTHEGVDVDWTRVPDEVVIKEPNKWGRAVVWYWFQQAKPQIRCFIPGAGI